MLNFFKKKTTLESVEQWNIPFSDAASKDDIFYCFRLILGRHPHREEWSGHTARVGENLESVVSSYIQSLEFSKRDLMGLDHMKHLRLASIEGFKMYAADDDISVGKHILRGGYEQDVTAVFRAHVKPGMNAIDIGANIGYYTMLLSSLAGPKGKVIAVEPNHRNTKLIEASRRANSFGNISIAQVAAGRDTGLLLLNTSHSNGLTSDLPMDINAILGAETVPCVKVDALVPSNLPINFIKIDVEGAEYNALLGCQGIIERHKPTIVSEFSPDLMPGISHITGPEYLKWLLSLGYKLGVVDTLDGHPTNQDMSIEAIMDAYYARSADHIDILARPQ